MGHYAAEMGYQTPAERAQEERKRLDAARKQFKKNPIPDLKAGDEVVIAVKEYYLLYNSIHRIFLEYCDKLINWVKVTKGIKVLKTKEEEGRTYVYFGSMCYTELWYDAQLFAKVVGNMRLLVFSNLFFIFSFKNVFYIFISSFKNIYYFGLNDT